MLYVYQVLAAILIGVALGALLVTRSNKALMLGALLAVVLGIATIATGQWLPLAVGVAVFLLGLVLQGAAVLRA